MRRWMDTARAVLVTGATSGIGYATARELTRAGWHVLLCGRDRRTAEAAANRLRGEAPAVDVHPVHCDHTRLADVRDFADWIDRKSTRLNSSHANISYA